MRWWHSRLWSRFGAKSSRERKPKWLPGLIPNVAILDVIIPNEIVGRDGEYRQKPTPYYLSLIGLYQILKILMQKRKCTKVLQSTSINQSIKQYAFNTTVIIVHGYKV